MKLTFKVHKSIDFVFEFLTDMQKFVLVHPVIYQINNIGNHRYLVYEKLKFGIVPLSFTYPVEIQKNELNKTITIVATVFKFTKIEMNFTLKADNDYTFIDEEICFKSKLPLKFIMKKIFKKQHTQLFANIEQVI